MDGPYDGDVADDAVHPLPDRSPHARGTDAPTGPHDREEYHRELRLREIAESRDRADGAETTDDGGWRWKGLELDPAENQIADRTLAALRQAEGRDDAGNYREAGITPAMRRIEAELEHGTLVPDTEHLALKSPDRFKEKLAKAIGAEPDVAPADQAARIHDDIRYTFIFEERSYSDGVREAEARLLAVGCECAGRKPGWHGTEYKGINSQWRDPDHCQLFEVQFHTPASWEAKQRTHDAYEMIENPSTPPQERTRLRQFQQDIVASVKTPPGALDFEYRKPEGRKS